MYVCMYKIRDIYKMECVICKLQRRLRFDYLHEFLISLTNF